MDVLFVDDHEPTRKGVRDLLEAEGLKTEVAENGLVALEAIATSETLPHVIMTDLDMPVMSGWELLDVLHADEKLRTIPVIIGSGNIDARVTGKAIAALPKPFDTAALLLLVTGLIDEARASATSGGTKAAGGSRI
jgi:CheY-like chemotaxis protein